MSRLLPLLLLPLLLARAGALEWTATSAVVRPAPLQRSAEAVFTFTNRGSAPVRVTGIDVSCDCTAARASADAIAPGASGEIRVRITLGDRFGSFQRTVTVASDDAREPAVLTVQLEVPELAHFDPRSAEWAVGAAPVPQEILLTAAPGLRLDVREVRPTNEGFTHRLVVDTAGARYRLVVAPADTRAPANVAFRIFARINDAEDVVLSAYANVR